MLNGLEVILNLIVVGLLPLAVHSLWRGTLPHEKTWLGRLYRTDPLMPVVGNLFLIALCLTTLVRLAQHFGLMPSGWQEPAQTATNMPFLILLVAYLGLMLRGVSRMRRSGGDKP